MQILAAVFVEKNKRFALILNSAGRYSRTRRQKSAYTETEVVLPKSRKRTVPYMNHCRNIGSLNLYCYTEQLPLCRVCIFLTDSAGTCVGSGITNSWGMVCLPFYHDGFYRIWAADSSPFQPAAQGLGICLNTLCPNCLAFPFRTAGEGSLLITLRDKNYPEYTLPKGVFTLWRIY